jgi:hypothetical protein
MRNWMDILARKDDAKIAEVILGTLMSLNLGFEPEEIDKVASEIWAIKDPTQDDIRTALSAIDTGAGPLDAEVADHLSGEIMALLPR